MQYHLNGFKSGDPSVADTNNGNASSHRNDKLPRKTDVLIVGCGPAGLTLAAQLSAFPTIKTVIVDQKPGPLQVGQADGIAVRSMEMFQAFGFAEQVLKEAYWVNETTFWKPDESQPDHIVRSDRIQDTEDGLSEFPHVILNQARVHDFYLKLMRNSSSQLQPHYGWSASNIDIDSSIADDTNAYPLTATFQHNGNQPGPSETLRAKYIVGCDGARSAIRKSLNLALHGDSANKAWGVMDILAVTDFPDIRCKTVIQSSTEGSIIIIPREGGYMVRLYIELDQLKKDQRVANQNITLEQLIAAAQRIFNPHTLDVKEVAWWSVYEIGQRLCDKFDDVPVGAPRSQTPRVFIAGDACHTHSPKAGQGMNVSMRDSFNLGWKLAAVLNGQCKPDLLHTYSAERQAVAKELIDFDRELASKFSTRTRGSKDKAKPEEKTTPEEFQRYFEKHARFTAGTAITYQPSMICAKKTQKQHVTGFDIGMRFHSAPVIRLADGKPTQLGHTVKADGRWRIFIFADQQTHTSNQIHRLCDLLSSAQSPVIRYTPTDKDIDFVFDIRAIFQQNFRDLALKDMPPLLLPHKGVHGLCDYEKIFCADSRTGNDIFDLRGIDRKNGCIVVVRPDQHIADILALSADHQLSAFFDGFMISPHP